MVNDLEFGLASFYGVAFRLFLNCDRLPLMPWHDWFSFVFPSSISYFDLTVCDHEWLLLGDGHRPWTLALSVGYVLGSKMEYRHHLPTPHNCDSSGSESVRTSLVLNQHHHELTMSTWKSWAKPLNVYQLIQAPAITHQEPAKWIAIYHESPIESSDLCTYKATFPYPVIQRCWFSIFPLFSLCTAWPVYCLCHFNRIGVL